MDTDSVYRCMLCGMDPIAEWQSRIEATFRGPGGIVGERSLALSYYEKQHPLQMLPHLWGFTALMDASQDFLIETLELASMLPPAPDLWNYSARVATFRRLRVALNVFWQGYYHDASALLRSVIDNALLFAALETGLIAHDDFFPPDAGQLTHDELRKQLEKRRRDADRTLRERLWGIQSGLPTDTQASLREYISLKHLDVHNCETSTVHLFTDAIRDKQWPSVFPVHDENTHSYFANSCICVGWMLIRVFPLGIKAKPYPDAWHAKWKVLDESFDYVLEQLAAKYPAAPWSAIHSFVHAKLPAPQSASISARK